MDIAQSIETIGVPAAVALVVQWCMDLLRREGEDIQRYKRRLQKMAVAIASGILLSVFVAFDSNTAINSAVILQGAIAGATASGGVSLAGKIASKAK